MTERVSLTRQISAVETELRDVRSGARTKTSMRREGIEAAVRTLRWVEQNATRVGPLPETRIAGDVVSLTRQIGAVGAEFSDGRRAARAKLSASQVQFQCDSLEAAANTLRWVQQNETRIRGVSGQ